MQVFVDGRGGRRRVVSAVNLIVACGLAGFAAVVAGTLLGVW